MLKTKKHKKKNKKYISTFCLAIATTAVLFLTVYFLSHKTLAWAEGWGAGIWNNYIIGHAENDPNDPPTIGWLKSSSGINGPCLLGDGYSVVFSSGTPGDSERFVSGKAWFGIGSETDEDGDCQSDLPSLGWLDFGAGFPSFCVTGDCHAARWHKTGSDNYTGYLDGWAKVTSMGDDGWVRLKGTGYEASCNSSAVLSGYSWNSGRENTISGNSGLGWIQMDGLKVEECNLGCATKILCGSGTFSSCDASFCSGSGASCILEADRRSWTCSNGCGSIPCTANIVVSEVGICGPLNGKSLCEPGAEVTDEDLCANGTTPHNFNQGAVTATWTCGSTDCGGSEASCSARTMCGWVETNP